MTGAVDATGRPIPIARPVSLVAIYATIVTVSYAATAGITTVYSMLSLLYREFDAPLTIGWVVTSYWLVASVCAAIGGRLGDVFGRRRLAIIVLAIAGVGSLISATSTTLVGIIAGCALQGTTGVLTPLLIGIVRENLPVEKVPLAVGVIAAAGTVGAGVSFMVAGYFIDHWSWSGGFYMKVVLALLSIAALLALVPKSATRGSLAGVNLVAGVMFAPAIAGIFIAFRQAAVWGWGDVRVWALLIGSCVVLVGWGLHQARQKTPLIDVRTLGHRQVLFANLAIGLLAMGCMQNGQIMSLLLQQPSASGIGYGLSATLAGLILLPLNSIALVGSPMAGPLMGRYSARAVALVGSVLIVVAWSLIALQHSTFALVLAFNVLALLGLSLVQPAAYYAVVQATPPQQTSEAMGIAYVFLNVCIAIGGQAVFLLLATSNVTIAGSTGTFPSEHAFVLVFGFVVVTALGGIVVAWLLPRTHRG